MRREPRTPGAGPVLDGAAADGRGGGALRVAYVCVDPGVPVFGCKGSSVHVQEVIRAFVRRGCRVDLFTCRRGGDTPRGLEGVRVHDLPAPTAADVAARERRARRLDHELEQALEAAGPFDLVYQRYSLWSHRGMAVARGAGVPGVLEVNAPLIREQARHRGLVDARAAHEVACRAFSDAAVVTAVSDAVADWVRTFPGTDGRIHVIPNGVDPDRFGAIAAPLPRSAPFTVGFVGTLKSWHGLPVLLEAFSRLLRGDTPVDARLLLVGDGPERSTLEATVRARGLLDRVEFTGAVDPDVVPALLARMDAAVAPYPPPGDEAFYFSPLKVLEYLAAGVPTVASRVGGVDGLIEHGVNGLLCPPGDAGALAQALRGLAADPESGRRMAREGHARVRRHHTWTGVVDRVVALAGLRTPAGEG